MMLVNDVNNMIAIQGGSLSQFLCGLISNEQFNLESQFSKAFTGAVNCLHISSREEHIMIELSDQQLAV